jgi:hypothetical protein
MMKSEKLTVPEYFWARSKGKDKVRHPPPIDGYADQGGRCEDIGMWFEMESNEWGGVIPSDEVEYLSSCRMQYVRTVR